MIHVGEYNTLKVARKASFGFFLDAGTGNTDDDILLPNNNLKGEEVTVGQEVSVFIYKDSKNRMVATRKEPKAKVGDLAYLQVVSVEREGAFIDIGVEKDVYVPKEEQFYPLKKGRSYLFHLYLDKLNRIEATTYINRKLHLTNQYKRGDEVEGIVYGIQENGNALIAVDGLYQGIIQAHEYFEEVEPGDRLKLIVKKYYEDGKISLSPRKMKIQQRDDDEAKILAALDANNGKIPFTDHSSPEEIQKEFGISKSAFKRAVGGLLRKQMIEQTEDYMKLK